ncbi:MAG TPA: hypothetical protein VL737_01405 [Candidatus Pristimantibacillus sp.]|nr:hypothetical protein [Candidatus Pristimantibacillus sp.]
MWARRIDNSAKEFGKLLLPEQIDRKMTLPLAALAIRSGKGRIALQSRKGVAGAWFPVSPVELPAPRSDREADIVRALENVLIIMAAELHIRVDQIRRVYGLAPVQPLPPELLAVRSKEGESRQTGILPLGIEMFAQPQMPDGSWFSPSEAGRHITSRAEPSERAVGMIMLTRAMTGR